MPKQDRISQSETLYEAICEITNQTSITRSLGQALFLEKQYDFKIIPGALSMYKYLIHSGRSNSEEVLEIDRTWALNKK
jgi:hypothetical protein